VQVDFAPPLDYVEPPRQPAQQAVPMAAEAPAGAAAAAEPEPEEPKFLAFAGSGQRLDGKPVSESRPIAIPLSAAGQLGGGSSSRALSAAGSVGSGAGGDGGGAAATGSAPKRPGKVFGGNRLQAKLADKAGGAGPTPPKPSPPPAEEKTEEEPRFKAFQGRGYSLKG
jgi:ubiquitin fusion degradation protein 1